MCPKQALGSCQKHSQAQRKRQGCILLSRGNGYSRLRDTKETEERDFLWLIPGRVCIRSARKTFFSAELETMRTSRSPTTVMTANGEVQTREDAKENVKELDSFVKVMLLEETPAVLSLGNICDEHGSIRIIGKAVRIDMSSKTARELIAINQTVCHSSLSSTRALNFSVGCSFWSRH